MARLKTIVAERAAWENWLAQVKRIHQWVLDAEHILDGSWAKPGERLSNAKVGRRFDRWRKTLGCRLIDGTLSPLERECLEQFLQVLSNLRSHLIQWYDHQEFPRTNNEMERSIRGRKHALSPHQRPQELEQLSFALRALRGVLRLVGAGRGQAATAAPTGRFLERMP